MVTILLGQGCFQPHQTVPKPSNPTHSNTRSTTFQMPDQTLSSPRSNTTTPPYTKLHLDPKRAERSTTHLHQLSDRKTQIPPDRFGSISLARSVVTPAVPSPMPWWAVPARGASETSAVVGLDERGPVDSRERWDEIV